MKQMPTVLNVYDDDGAEPVRCRRVTTIGANQEDVFELVIQS